MNRTQQLRRERRVKRRQRLQARRADRRQSDTWHDAPWIVADAIAAGGTFWLRPCGCFGACWVPADLLVRIDRDPDAIRDYLRSHPKLVTTNGPTCKGACCG
jgi:hypothetical protein